MTRTCEDCAHWQPMPERPGHGTCCAHAPTQTDTAIVQAGPVHAGEWPVTPAGHEWCGDGKQRPPA
jgi:hypothetical protein